MDALVHERTIGSPDVSMTSVRVCGLAELGEALTSERERQGVSQATLAAKCGVHIQTIRRLERGGGEDGRGMSMATVIDVFQVLGVDVQILLQQRRPRG